MAKKSIVTNEDTGTSEAPSEAQLVAEAPFFEPTDEQRKVKVRWFTRVKDNPSIDPLNSPLTLIQQVTGSAGLKAWWPIPGFRDWFLNASEHAEALEVLFHQSLRAMNSIINNEEPKVQGARVQLIKHLAEITSKMPKKQQTAGQFLDKAIAGMDEYALAAFLEKNGVQLSVGIGKKQLPSAKVEPVQSVLDIESK